MNKEKHNFTLLGLIAVLTITFLVNSPHSDAYYEAYRTQYLLPDRSVNKTEAALKDKYISTKTKSTYKDFTWNSFPTIANLPSLIIQASREMDTAASILNSSDYVNITQELNLSNARLTKLINDIKFAIRGSTSAKAIKARTIVSILDRANKFIEFIGDNEQASTLNRQTLIQSLLTYRASVTAQAQQILTEDQIATQNAHAASMGSIITPISPLRHAASTATNYKRFSEHTVLPRIYRLQHAQAFNDYNDFQERFYRLGLSKISPSPSEKQFTTHYAPFRKLR